MRRVFLIALIAMPAVAHPQSYAWITEGERLENGVVQLLMQEDTAAAVGVVRALALRDDQYVEDIIGPLLLQLGDDREALLEAYLDVVLSRGEERAAQWARVNPTLLNELIRALGELRRTRLRGAILRMAAHAQSEDIASRLAVHARDTIAGKLRKPPEYYEVLALLEAISSTNASELAMLAVALGRISASPAIAREARVVAAALLTGTSIPR